MRTPAPPPWCDPKNPAARKYVLPLMPYLAPFGLDICDPTNLPIPGALGMGKGPRFTPKGVGSPPGKGQPPFKPTDALRQHNKQARDAARAAGGLTQDQFKRFHREIHGRNLTYHD